MNTSRANTELKQIRNTLADANSAQLDDCKSKIKVLETSSEINHSVTRELIERMMKETVFSQESSKLQDSLSLLSKVEGQAKELKIAYKNIRMVQSEALIHQQFLTEQEAKLSKLKQEHEEETSEMLYSIKQRDKIIASQRERNNELKEDALLAKKCRNTILAEPTPELLQLHLKLNKLKELMKAEARKLYMCIHYKTRFYSLQREAYRLTAVLRSSRNRKSVAVPKHVPHKHRRTASDPDTQICVEVPVIHQISNDDSFEDLEYSVQGEFQHFILAFKEGVANLKREYFEHLNSLLPLIESNRVLKRENHELARKVSRAAIFDNKSPL